MLKLKGTKTTPTIQFDPKNGRLLIEGKSSPENSIVFYQPLLDTIRATVDLTNFSIDVKLIYFNTSTVRCLNLLFQLFVEKKEQGAEVTVNWHSEDDDLDMIEMGEDFEEISELTFNYLILED